MWVVLAKSLREARHLLRLRGTEGYVYVGLW